MPRTLQKFPEEPVSRLVFQARNTAYPIAAARVCATSRQRCLDPRQLDFDALAPCGRESSKPKIRLADVCNPAFQIRAPGTHAVDDSLAQFPKRVIIERGGSRHPTLTSEGGSVGTKCVVSVWWTRASLPLALLSPRRRGRHHCQTSPARPRLLNRGSSVNPRGPKQPRTLSFVEAFSSNTSQPYLVVSPSWCCSRVSLGACRVSGGKH